ncbi:MAG: LytTR family DNA-binding domain-containing protein [Crocinitomicaceae bacterium]|nr:LytTR family DNA-binding domain-containing protein [Crocinitomicaceae bacterium]
MRTVIIDDTRINREALLKLIELKLPKLEVVGQANSLETGIQEMKEKKPELLILDIELGDGTGFQLLDQISNLDFNVIFVTAFDQYAIQAFKVSAVDYLLKPVNTEELIAAVDKIETKGSNSENIKSLSALMNQKNEVLSVSTQNGFESIEIADLVRCEADGKYTHCIRLNGKNFTSSKNLKEFEKLLIDKNFARVHHSHLINLNLIKSFNRYDSIVTMTNQEEVPISQRKKRAFIEKVNLI